MPRYTASRRALTYLHLAATGALAFAGCSSSPSLEEACTGIVNVVRSRETSCYGVAPEPDESTLKAREIQSCVLTSGAPGSQVDASYWESCAAMANNGCAGYKCPTYPPGTRQIGEACLVSTQCTSLWCKGTTVVGAAGAALPDAVQCGACASRLAQGAPCDVATDVCDDGLSCFGGACRTLGQQGAPCAYWSDCALPEVVCKSTGFCDAVTPDGQPCGNSYDCGTDTGCDVTTKLCMAVQFAQPGGACDGEVHRCEAGRCNRAAGVCATLLADGATCDPADPSKVCGEYAYCFEGTCQIPDPATCK